MNKRIALLFCAAALSLSTHLFSFQISPELMRQYQISKSLGFARGQTPFEVYFISDWSSDTDKQLDPAIQKMAPDIMNEANVYFFDVLKPETKNLTDANISLVLDRGRNFEGYLEARSALFALAQKNKNPSVEDIKAALLPLKLEYAPIDAKTSDIAKNAFASLEKNFNIKESPTVLVYNLNMSEKRVLSGKENITKERILAAIKDLKESQAKAEKELEEKYAKEEEENS